MKLWVLGYIIDKAEGEEWTNWNLWGIFFAKEEALSVCTHINFTKPESFFVAPVKAGELLSQDIM
ncbi:MAG: hypothetical protein AB1390_12500 [Nitrospirota bacterium]